MTEESDISLAIERDELMRARQIRNIQASLAVEPGLGEQRDCAICGDEIPPARIKALPSATRCVNCQQLAERR